MGVAGQDFTGPSQCPALKPQAWPKWGSRWGLLACPQPPCWAPPQGGLCCLTPCVLAVPHRQEWLRGEAVWSHGRAPGRCLTRKPALSRAMERGVPDPLLPHRLSRRTCPATCNPTSVPPYLSPPPVPLGAFHPAPMTVCLETSPLVGQTREPGVHSRWRKAPRPGLACGSVPPPLAALWE